MAMKYAVLLDIVQSIDLKENHKVSLTFEVFDDNLNTRAIRIDSQDIYKYIIRELTFTIR
jgi:hypothetical protein